MPRADDAVHSVLNRAMIAPTVAATQLTVDSDKQLTVIAPPGSGAVTITVATPFGTSNGVGFGYAAAAPTLTALSPSSGPAAGGTMVALTGTSFGSVTAVTFGGAAATEVQLLSETSVTAIAPAGTGTVDVTLTTPSGTSNAVSYTYE